MSGASIDTGVLMRRMLNDRLMLAERGLLDADGLQGNRWFKHLVGFNFYILKVYSAKNKEMNYECKGRF